MRFKLNKMAKWVAVVAIMAIGVVCCIPNDAMADGYGLTVAPMKQNMVINPGDSQEGSFRISNPSSSTQDVYYSIEVEPFYNNEKGEISFQEEAGMSEAVDWVRFTVPTEGKLAPNESGEVSFVIDVPKTAPAGGQYVSISVTASAGPTDEGGNTGDSGEDPQATIKEVKKMGHLVYAEITGNVIKRGQITDVDMSGFLLSGKITGSAMIKNEGNVHGDAKYFLQIFPFSSNEELYSNEEQPATYTILPNRSQFVELAWDETPAVGVFEARFTVEFEGEIQQITKMVIVCPVWLLFLIIFVVAALIIWIVARMKARGKGDKKKAE